MAAVYTRRESSRPRWREGQGGGRRREGGREGGNVNSRQHVQPRKSDLGGQCSPCKQAIVEYVDANRSGLLSSLVGIGDRETRERERGERRGETREEGSEFS